MSDFQSRWLNFGETLTNQSSKSSESPSATSATSIPRVSEKINNAEQPPKSSEIPIGGILEDPMPLHGCALAWAGVRADIERRDQERVAAMARQRAGRRKAS